jgi:uncharacterized damage-inducible protein DinB
MTDTPTQPTPTFITPEALLAHWQGHQRLTRRTLEVFPEDQLFSFTPAPPMRNFGELALEVVQMIEPTVRGLWRKEWVTARYWQALKQQPAPDKAQLLELWDQAGEYLREHWPHIPAGRFYEVEAVFGMPPTPLKDLVLYQIDNEVHHRAQGYVYLRLLGVEPPAFWER